MGEIQPKTCEGRELSKNQLADGGWRAAALPHFPEARPVKSRDVMCNGCEVYPVFFRDPGPSHPAGPCTSPMAHGAFPAFLPIFASVFLPRGRPSRQPELREAQHLIAVLAAEARTPLVNHPRVLAVPAARHHQRRVLRGPGPERVGARQCPPAARPAVHGVAHQNCVVPSRKVLLACAATSSSDLSRIRHLIRGLSAAGKAAARWRCKALPHGLPTRNRCSAGVKTMAPCVSVPGWPGKARVSPSEKLAPSSGM